MRKTISLIGLTVIIGLVVSIVSTTNTSDAVGIVTMPSQQVSGSKSTIQAVSAPHAANSVSTVTQSRTGGQLTKANPTVTTVQASTPAVTQPASPVLCANDQGAGCGSGDEQSIVTQPIVPETRMPVACTANWPNPSCIYDDGTPVATHPRVVGCTNNYPNPSCFYDDGEPAKF